MDESLAVALGMAAANRRVAAASSGNVFGIMI